MSYDKLAAFRREIVRALVLANRFSNRENGWNDKLARRLKIPVKDFNVDNLTLRQCHIVKFYLERIIAGHLASPLDKPDSKV